MVPVDAIVDEGLGNSAYVVDLGDGGALIVDPQRDPRPYRRQIRDRGLVPRWVVETHLHADFVSGGPELVAAGAQLAAPEGSRLHHPHRALRDGDELALGGLTLQVIATPGHTPEHMAYLLSDGARPVALFSGGTLIAGGVARTDLLAPELTEPLAREAYRSIHRRLLALPDDLPVYPTHGAGSFCAAGDGGGRTTTIGRERSTNPLLVDDPGEDAFVARLLAGYGTFPPYFLELRDVNRAGPAVLGSAPRLPRLSAAQVEAAVASGTELVDVRGIRSYAAGHVPGSLSNAWRPQFATWLGWLVEQDRPIAFVIGEVDEADVVWACLTVGFEHLAGVLEGGVDAWAASGRPVATTPLLRPDEAEGRLVVDVRQATEHAGGHVAGAVHVELGRLAEQPGVVDPAPVLVHCGHGERAMTAASLLERGAHPDVAVLRGGPADLAAAVEP